MMRHGHPQAGVMRLWLVALLAGLLPLPALSAVPAENRVAPPFEIRAFDGTKFSAENTRGKVVLLTFWATWCHSCREEMPALEKFYRAHRHEGLEVVAINVDDASDAARVKSVISAYSFPNAPVSASDMANYGSIAFVPMTFLIDRKGVLRKSAWTGSQKLNAASLNRYVRPLLRER